MTNSYTVYDDGVLRITSTVDPPGLALAGEIDESTYPGLLSALRGVADGRAEVHVSLGDVRYCDLAGLRALVSTTDSEDGVNGPYAGPRAVVLHEVPAQLITVLRIVGWDSTPGLTVMRPDGGVPPAPAPDRRGSVVA
jgi:ABC-type transporter Mla MlaB component